MNKYIDLLEVLSPVYQTVDDLCKEVRCTKHTLQSYILCARRDGIEIEYRAGKGYRVANMTALYELYAKLAINDNNPVGSS